MGLRSCFCLSRSWPVGMLVVVLAASCAAPDDAVESTGRGIRNGTLMGTGGIGFAAKIDQVMSDGTRLICSGAFITPHVVLTAAHCTRNYDYGTTITPTTDTVIRYGASFASSQKIAGDEKVGWRELGSTDIGLYRVAQAVSLPAIPKLYRSCSTVNLVGGSVVVYGRMINGNQAPTADYYMSPARTVRGIANGVGANGNYVQIDPTTDAGDSGGPWVYNQDRIVAVTHTSEYGSRFCDVASEVETQVTAWGDTLAFVEDGAGGADGGSASQGGASGSADAASRSGGAGGTSARDAGGAGARAGAGGGAAGASGSAGRSGAAGSSATGSGGAATGGVVAPIGTGGSIAGSGGKGPGGSGGNVTGSGAAGSAGQAGAATAGSSGGGTGAQGGGSPVTTGAGGAVGPRTDSGASSGCSCRIPGNARHAGPSAGLLLFAVFASAIAIVRIRRLNK